MLEGRITQYEKVTIVEADLARVVAGEISHHLATKIHMDVVSVLVKVMMILSK